jgi:hypothetical protein
MSDGILTQGNLFPLRDVSQHEIVNRYALDGTGLNGLFVSYQTGNQNPETADGYSSQSVGTSYTNTFTTRYFNNRRVRPAAAGDTKWQVAGVTLNTVAEYDENGQKLVLLPPKEREERGFVLTGQTVPLAKRGFVMVKKAIVNGTPIAGYPFVATGVGQIAVLSPSVGNQTGWANLVLGRFTSSTGANNGGYVEVEVQL